jgi:hypothetical protein
MTACVIMHNMVLEDAQECKMEPMNKEGVGLSRVFD